MCVCVCVRLSLCLCVCMGVCMFSGLCVYLGGCVCMFNGLCVCVCVCGLFPLCVSLSFLTLPLPRPLLYALSTAIHPKALPVALTVRATCRTCFGLSLRERHWFRYAR